MNVIILISARIYRRFPVIIVIIWVKMIMVITTGLTNLVTETIIIAITINGMVTIITIPSLIMSMIQRPLVVSCRWPVATTCCE